MSSDTVAVTLPANDRAPPPNEGWTTGKRKESSRCTRVCGLAVPQDLGEYMCTQPSVVGCIPCIIARSSSWYGCTVTRWSSGRCNPRPAPAEAVPKRRPPMTLEEAWRTRPAAPARLCASRPFRDAAAPEKAARAQEGPLPPVERCCSALYAERPQPASRAADRGEPGVIVPAEPGR